MPPTTNSDLPATDTRVQELEERLRGIEAELASLRKSEQRWRHFAEATFEGILLHDGLRVKDVNPQFVELFGFEREWVIGRPILEFVAPESKHKVKEILMAKSTEPYDLVLLDAREEPVRVLIRPRQMGDDLRMAVFRTVRLEPL